MAKIKILTKGKHKWPESIDFDNSGNLYFSDHAEKALFRIKRNPDGTFAPEDEKLLSGFEHIGGISIEKDNNCIYLGVRVNKMAKIIKISLNLFEAYTNIDYQSFNWDNLENNSLIYTEFDIETRGENQRLSKPNGVIFDKRNSSVIYTHTHPNGFVGKTDKGFIKELYMPNGIDIDPNVQPTVAVISLLFDSTVVRLNLADETAETSSKKFGFLLDGLLCLENGDLLVASFLSKKIFHLSWDGKKYKNPYVVKHIGWLGCPTDLSINRSSDGPGESLFITTTWPWGKLPLFKCGKVIEISNIRELIIQNKRYGV